jgi:hypothetical protein
MRSPYKDFFLEVICRPNTQQKLIGKPHAIAGRIDQIELKKPARNEANNEKAGLLRSADNLTTAAFRVVGSPDYPKGGTPI